MTTKTSIFPTLAEIENEQANYEYYLQRLQKIQRERPIQIRQHEPAQK